MSETKLVAREEKIKEKQLKKAEEKMKPKEEIPKEKKKVEVKKPKTNKAVGRGTYLPISPKVATEIGRTIKGWKVDKAKRFLKDVMELKRAVPYRRYNKEVPHQTGVGPGRYPQKVAKYVLEVLENAIANAKYFDLSEDDLYIKYFRVERAISRERGKYANVEITVEEKVKE